MSSRHKPDSRLWLGGAVTALAAVTFVIGNWFWQLKVREDRIDNVTKVLFEDGFVVLRSEDARPRPAILAWAIETWNGFCPTSMELPSPKSWRASHPVVCVAYDWTTPVGREILPPLLSALPDLEVLELPTLPARELMPIIGAMHNLESLELHYSGLTDKDLSQLASLSRLRTLSLSTSGRSTTVRGCCWGFRVSRRLCTRGSRRRMAQSRTCCRSDAEQTQH